MFSCLNYVQGNLQKMNVAILSYRDRVSLKISAYKRNRRALIKRRIIKISKNILFHFRQWGLANHQWKIPIQIKRCGIFSIAASVVVFVSLPRIGRYLAILHCLLAPAMNNIAD